jgi:hypothetical protein
VHWPLMQASPVVPQALPQEPQFFVSVCVLTQVPLHKVELVSVHVHLLPLQVVPEGHGLLQPPQLFVLELVSTQAPLQQLCPAAQHLP